MYDKCYFCLYQLQKLKKESTASFFVNFVRSRGTKEPTYITVVQNCRTASRIARIEVVLAEIRDRAAEATFDIFGPVSFVAKSPCPDIFRE